jgi:hypothetical protein
MAMSVTMKSGFGVAVLASGLALSASAQQMPTMPDAQVESNVLKALASAPELSTQNIQTTTVYGVVTLSGSATDEVSRTKAENLVARVAGVKKVVDEMTIGGVNAQNAPDPNGGDPAQGDPSQQANNNGPVLQSDGTYAPAPGGQDQGPQPMQGPQGPPPPQGQQGPPQDGQQADNSYGPPPPPSNGQQYPPRRPMYGGPQGYQPGYPPVQGGQIAGKQVTVPNGALVQIRINQGITTHHTQPGAIFDGTVLNDVVADGAVAIPRGAAVQGTVVEVKDSGNLKGRAQLALQLTTLTLGGQTYQLTSDVWSQEGADKTKHTVGSAIGLGAVGALFGAAVGGGPGAAIGAAAGGAAGVASSAATPNGRVIIPPEAVLTFHLAQPTKVATVSQQEMQRLSYAAGPNPRPRGYAPGPGYYPRYY